MRFVSFRIAFFSLALALAATVGCKAQNSAQNSARDPLKDPVLARHIEVLVRNQFTLPVDYEVALGGRKPSDIPGYDTLEITLSHNGHSTSTDFLISKDNKTLGRLEKYDLAHIPAENIDIDNRPIRGNPTAKVTVISFDDLECPYCARMHQQLFPETLDRYQGKVRFIYKDDPLTDIHPWALHAAVDSNCIGAQNASAYWGYVDYLHAHGHDVSGDGQNLKNSFATLDKIAREQGKIFALDAAKLDACLEKQDETAVRASMKEAEALGVEGTPYVFIDGERINGAQPVEQVWMILDRALRAAGVPPPPPVAPSSTTPSQPPKLGK